MKNNFKIDKHIPIGNHGNRRYDFGAMDIGDSHLLDDPKKRYAIFSAVRWYNEQNGTHIKVQTRKEGNSVRFTRIA